MKIQSIDINQLTPHAMNPRSHSDAQILKIASSIKEFGFNQPIVVSEDMKIIAGHGRFAAAQRIGMREVPCIVVSMGEGKELGYMIADNKISDESQFDDSMLAAVIKSIEDMDLSASITSIDDDELSEILTKANSILLEDEDDTTEPSDESDTPNRGEAVETSIKKGDIIKLGNSYLMCADCTDKMNVEKLISIAGCKPNCIITDPPYNVDYAGAATPRKKISNDNLGEGFSYFLEKSIGNCVEEMGDGAIYVCMSGKEIGTLQSAMRKLECHESTIIVFRKSHFVVSHGDYHPQHEMCWYGKRNGFKRYFIEDRTQSNVWDFKKPSSSNAHPTMKPLDIIERMVSNSTRINELVIDPFAGSGTTLIACERLKRRCVTLEIDDQFCEKICQRYESLFDISREVITK